MKKKKNKTIKLAKQKIVKMTGALVSGMKKIRSKEVKLGMMRMAKPMMALIFVLLLASGFIFQSKIRQSAAGYFIAKGNYYFNNGAYDRKKAERYFSWAVQLDPKADSAYYQLGRIHLVSGKFDLARQEIDMALAINPENKRSFYIRGLIDGYDKKYDDAISDFQQFVAYSPTEWAGHNDLAWAYFLKKDFAKVREAAQDGLDRADDQNPWLLNGLGVAYVNLGEPEKAQDIFARAQKISGDITPERWIKAYPGNDPSQAEQNLKKFKTDMGNNFQLATNGFTNGGTVFSACGSSGCTPDCSTNPWRCPNDFYPDGCGGTCQGTKDCSCTPDCSGVANRCVGDNYGDGCGGTCYGTKNPIYTKVCSYSEGAVCDQSNCNKTITAKTARCLGLTNNGCGPSPTILPLASCPSICKDQTAACPPCSWKEIAP